MRMMKQELDAASARMAEDEAAPADR